MVEPVWLKTPATSRLIWASNSPGSSVALRSTTRARIMAVTSAARTSWPITSQMNRPTAVSESGITLKKSPLTAPAGKKKLKNSRSLSARGL